MTVKRRNPILVATRVTRRDRAKINAAARAEGLTVTGLLRRIVLTAVNSPAGDDASALDPQKRSGNAAA